MFDGKKSGEMDRDEVVEELLGSFMFGLEREAPQ
jgi:hypothetical protein